MRLHYLFFLVVIVTAANVLVAAETEPSMLWISPRNVSLVRNFPEVFTAEKGDWADLETGAGSRGGVPVVHMDSKGTLWIMGGYLNLLNLNAIWNYDPVQDQYRWVAGNATYDGQYRNFGQMGVPSDDVFPGLVTTSSHAIDKNDNIWIYGSTDDNTMWMFNTTSLQFTYIGGNDTNLDIVVGDIGVESEKNWPGLLQGACTVVDSKNNIWMLGGFSFFRSSSLGTVWRYNISSRMWSLQWSSNSSNQIPNYENKIWPGRWTPGCTIDEDDRVWLFGGYASTTPLSWNDMWSFDIKTVTWTVERETNSSMLSGNVVSFDTFDIDNYPSRRDYLNMIDRRDGTIMLFGGRDADVSSLLNDVWVFNKTNKLWKVVAGSPNNVTIVKSVYGQYRGIGSQLGSRQAYGSESGLNAKGNFIIVAGEPGSGYLLNDIWIIPQDQCLTTLNDCDPNASCTMGSWTFECTCNEGYTGDGKTCTTVATPTAPSASPIDNANAPTDPTNPVSTPPTASPTSTPQSNSNPNVPSTETSGTAAQATPVIAVFIATLLIVL